MDFKQFVNKIFLLFLSVLLCFIIFISVLNYSKLSSNISDQIKNDNFGTLKHIDQNMTIVLENLDLSILTFINSLDLIKYLEGNYESEMDKTIFLNDLQAKIYELILARKGISSIYMYSEITGTVISENKFGNLNTFEDKSWYESYKNMSTLYKIQGSSIIRTLPVTYKYKQGAIIINLSASYVYNLLSDYVPNKICYVLDMDNNIIAGNKNVPLKINGNLNYQKIKYNGEKYIAFSMISESKNWKYVVLQNKKDVYMILNSNLIFMVILTIMMLALALIVLYVINRATIKPIDYLDDQIKSNLSSIKYKKMIDLLSGNNVSDITDLDLYKGKYIVIMVKAVDGFENNMLANIEEIIQEHTKGLGIIINGDTLACILSFETDLDIDIYEISNIIADYIRTILVFEYNLDIFIGIGDIAIGVENVGVSSNQANNALKYYAVKEKNPIICFSDIRNEIKNDSYDAAILIDKLTRAIEKSNYNLSIEYVDKFFEIVQANLMSIDYIRQFTLQIITSILKIARNKQLDIHNESDMYELVSSKKSIYEFKLLLTETIALLEKESKIEFKNQTNELLDNVVKYLDEDYSNCDMSLSYIADKFNINVSYLSRLFKSCIDKTFLEYLIEKRMEKAKCLLIHTNMQINVIGNNVGYRNYASFIKTFKKYTGMSAGEYRDMKKMV